MDFWNSISADVQSEIDSLNAWQSEDLDEVAQGLDDCFDCRDADGLIFWLGQGYGYCDLDNSLFERIDNFINN